MINNITNPNADPVEGDIVESVDGGNVVRYQFHEPAAPSAEDARSVRDQALTGSDATPADHSQFAEIMAYRQSLRDWPQTADFPDITKLPQHP